MTETIVIKIGGVASQSLSNDFLEQVAQWTADGKQIVIVHGGGFAINKLMKEHQVPVTKIKGLRVTSQTDMTLVSRALLDMVGHDMTRKLNQAGLDSVQLLSDLERVVAADFLDKDIYGYVGQVTKIHTAVLDKMLADGMIPVLASLGYSPDGELLNINADYLATAVATALGAEQLILMTDVKGVLENGQVLAQLLTKNVAGKIEAGVITGGMIPKIESAAKTVAAGVKQVLIGDNLTSGTLIKE